MYVRTTEVFCDLTTTVALPGTVVACVMTRVAFVSLVVANVICGTAAPNGTPTAYVVVLGENPATVVPATFKSLKEASAPATEAVFQK